MSTACDKPLELTTEALTAKVLPVDLERQTSRSRVETGRLVAKALAGSWRVGLPDVTLQSSEINDILPLLIWTGGGGLAWWHWRQTTLLDTKTAKKLQQVYLLHSTRAVISEQDIKRAFTSLRAAGIEPLLGKGWAVARHYPETGLRPYGDIDLCVPIEQLSAAQQVLKNQPPFYCPIDLHCGFSDLSDRRFESLFKRSQLAGLDDVKVRILGAEDQLRLLCLHLLRHGGWRPIWFCDLAVMLENLPPDFDWQYLLSGPIKNAEWVLATLELAHRLVAAQRSDDNGERWSIELPDWLVKAVLQQWGAIYQHRDPPMQLVVKDARSLLAALRHRWPDTIEATIAWNGSINGLPPISFQLLEAAHRITLFSTKMLKKLF